MYRNSRKSRWNDGSTVVEAALTLSAFMLLFFGIIEFGYALWQWNTMMLAVQQAGRWAMINNTNTSITTNAEAQMQAVLPSAAVCTMPTAGQICVKATTTGVNPQTMTLTAAYNFNLVSPLIPSFTMTSQTVVPLD